MDTFDKYWWVFNHPVFNKTALSPQIELQPHRVDPKTRSIREDDSKNTQMEWWVEVFFYSEDNISMHDYYLDCGGDTIDQAINNLYDLVKTTYGEYDE